MVDWKGKYGEMYGNRNFHSQELLLPGAKVPHVEVLLQETKMTWNFCCQSEIHTHTSTSRHRSQTYW